VTTARGTATRLTTARVTVVSPGVQTTVQDVDGRGGLWDVGVPPSGAFDEFSMALANAAVGNPPTAAGLECVVRGPVLRFDRPTLACVTGAAREAHLDGRPFAAGAVIRVPAGSLLDVGPLDGPGMRGYLAVAGGLDVPRVLGSRSTFILGGFGGMDGRPLAPNDQIMIGSTENLTAPIEVHEVLPALTNSWTLRVIPGPHGSPDHLTEAGVEHFFAAGWQVDHRADRTGVRLIGPAPGWARTDGGEAGLHPSNLHDSAYPVGGIMLTGDTAVIVGKDGPSLGGFVVPAVVIGADRWKLGQLRPGDQLRLLPTTPQEADAAMAVRRRRLTDLRAAVAQEFAIHLGRGKPTAKSSSPVSSPRGSSPHGSSPRGSSPFGSSPDAAPVATPVVSPMRPDALVVREADAGSPSYSIRRSGDRHLLVEAGEAELDLSVRVWIHLLAQALRSNRPSAVTEIVEGVRSLLIAVDDSRIALSRLADHLASLTASLDDPATVTLPVRGVTLPIAFDHPEAHKAMRRYATSVRPDAPWCPDNVEFIRRVNDLGARTEVFDIVAAATYLVIGLGDVYLGAPVAVPIDPRHRLVTTKYNPARTWTPQNAVGIGGIYLCVYGMEGPGGYQLVGRTVPIWRLSGRDEQPWLLRQFDRLRFTPVSADELADQRAEIKAGRADLVMRPATFSVREVTALTSANADEIATVRAERRAAFDAERMRWTA
jgi:urea carboxylase